MVTNWMSQTLPSLVGLNGTAVSRAGTSEKIVSRPRYWGGESPGGGAGTAGEGLGGRVEGDARVAVRSCDTGTGTHRAWATPGCGAPGPPSSSPGTGTPLCLPPGTPPLMGIPLPFPPRKGSPPPPPNTDPLLPFPPGHRTPPPPPPGIPRAWAPPPWTGDTGPPQDMGIPPPCFPPRTGDPPDGRWSHWGAWGWGHPRRRPLWVAGGGGSQPPSFPSKPQLGSSWGLGQGWGGGGAGPPQGRGGSWLGNV